MSGSLIIQEYEGVGIPFSDSGAFNATIAGAHFGKKPIQWLRLEETKRYLAAMCDRHEVPISHFVKTSRGGGAERRKASQGTWLHKSLAVAYARWLDPGFGCWADEIIDHLLRRAPEKLRALEAEIAQLKVGHQALERIAAADGLACLADVAATLRAPLPKLKQWMLAGGWTYERGQQTLARVDAVRAGWLKNSVYTYAQDDTGRDRLRYQVLVSPAGLVELSTAIATATASAKGIRLRRPPAQRPVSEEGAPSRPIRTDGNHPSQHSQPSGEAGPPDALTMVVAEALTKIISALNPPKPQPPSPSDDDFPGEW